MRKLTNILGKIIGFPFTVLGLGFALLAAGVLLIGSFFSGSKMKFVGYGVKSK